jgi:DNA-binding response OmpR family regulator
VHERVLVVDDDPPVRRMLERVLRAEGFDVQVAADGGSALAAVERMPPDVILLDVAMPGVDGLYVARRLRAAGVDAAILMLTARDAVPDRVAGLDAGADDYLVKPFAPEELIARIRALRRRDRSDGSVVGAGDLTLEPGRRRATRAGREVDLSARETQLLELLIRNRRQVVTRDRALEEIWRDAAGPNVVDRYVTNLRAKLGEPSLIRTVRGLGFILDQ